MVAEIVFLVRGQILFPAYIVLPDLIKRVSITEIFQIGGQRGIGNGQFPAGDAAGDAARL